MDVKKLKDTKAQDAHASPRSPFSGTFLIAAASMAIVIALAGLVLFRIEYRHQRDIQFREMATVGNLKASQIVAWRERFMSDAHIFARSPLLAEAVEQLVTQPRNKELATVLSARLGLYVTNGACDEAALYTIDGRLLVEGEGGRVGCPPALGADAMHILRGTVADNQPQFQDVYRRADGLYSIDVLAPVPNEAGTAMAVLVLSKDPERGLFPLIRSWPVPSTSAETYLVRCDGNQVITLNRLLYDASEPLSKTFPLSRTDLPGVKAALGGSGPVLATDYRGRAVVADISPIPSSPWFIVAKVDASEAFAQARRYGTIFSAAAFGLFIIVLSLLAFMLSQKQKSLYRELYHEERRRADLHAEFSATLFGIGDGVISTDANGKVRWLNAAAARLTGWTEEEAGGHQLSEVFRICNEDTRLEVANPSELVVRTGGIVGLANHTILIAKDGTEHAIADSGAPIRGDDGSIQGVVLVFQDVSKARAAEAKAEWLSATVERSLNEVLIFDAKSLRFTYANRAALVNLGYTAEELYALTPLDIKPAFTAERFAELLAPLRSGASGTITLATIHRRRDGSTYDVFLSMQLLAGRGGRHFVAIGLDFSERLKLETELRRRLIERETLLRELHHRTKNNLQVVSSLLSLQASELCDESARAALGEMESRVGTIALAHELLYQSDSFAEIELGSYLASIITMAVDTYGLGSRVQVRVDCSPVEVSIDCASPLGLIVNELATNSAKYAFPDGRHGNVRFSLHPHGDGELKLEFSDDGVGVPPHVDLLTGGHLGMTLIRSLAEHQLGGRLTMRGDNGFYCAVQFEAMSPRVLALPT